MAARFVYFDFFYVAIEVAHIPTLILSFFFTKVKDEIRNLSSSKGCRCLQAQWWKAKSLLDRWNLPSGYVSSMESNFFTSENFSKCRLVGNSSKCREKKWWKRLSVDRRKSSSFFPLSWDFSQKLFFFELLQVTLTRSWWWNVASNLIAVVEAEVERRARCMTRENSSKCRDVEQIF
jgi:hypothetical protein